MLLPAVIFCRPPIQVIRENVEKDPEGQMPGVRENTDTIVALYDCTLAYWQSGSYCMTLARWDYTARDSEADFALLVNAIDQNYQTVMLGVSQLDRPEGLN
jgi:hypothetical protein